MSPRVGEERPPSLAPPSLAPAAAAPASAGFAPGVLGAACAIGLGLVLPLSFVPVAGAGTVRLLFPVYALAAGVALAARRRPLYPAFCLALFAFAPFLRRYLDYKAGWVTFNPVLLAPYVALLPTIAALARRALLPGMAAGWAFAAISACAFYGTVLALLQGMIVPGFYEPLRWVLPVGLCAFIAEHAREAEVTHRAIVGALAAVVPAVALYGVVQYVAPPAWDVFWMQNLSITVGSFGVPEAFKIRPFSTLNSPGSLGLFLATAVVVLAGAGRFLAAAAGTALLVLSVVRAGWLAAAVGLVVLLLWTSPRRRLSLASAMSALVFVASAGLGALQLGPEVLDGILSRLDSFSNLSTDDSAGERLQTYRAFFDRLADAPFGEGFGANDSMAAAVSKQNRVTLDSGILDVFLTFGVIGGTVWFLAVGTLLRRAWREVAHSRDVLAGHLGAVAALVSAFPLGTSAVGEVSIVGWIGLGLLLAGAGRINPAARAGRRGMTDAALPSAALAAGAAASRADTAAHPRTFYPGVQGLRGISAVSVLGVHLFLMAEHAGFLPGDLPWPLAAIVATFGQGVGLFFIISGFVIPASLDRHGDLRRFFLDRVLRIMPLYATIHVLVFAIGPVIGYKWLRGIELSEYMELFLGNLFFLAPLIGQPLAQQNSWSLTYEWIFYGAVACAWAAARAPGGRLLFPAAGVCAMAACVVWPGCTFFLLGMAFARLRRVPVVPKAAELFLLPSAVVWFYGAAQYVHPFAALPAGAVVFALVLAPGSLASALLRRPFFQFLGRISYSLYLLHPIALFPFQLAGGRLAALGFDRGVLFAAFLVLAPAAALVLSVLGHRVIEVRARDWLAARLGGGRGERLRGDPVETTR